VCRLCLCAGRKAGQLRRAIKLPDGALIMKQTRKQALMSSQFDVMVTSVCNARCAFCVQEATFKPPCGKDAKFLDALRDSFGWFYTNGGRRVVITGGESLLEFPRVKAVLAELKQYKDLQVKALYTNGSLLLRRLSKGARITAAETLAKAGLGCVNLSVHHYDNDINNAMLGLPGKPRTEDIVKHLEACGLPFRLNLTLQRGGISTAGDLINYVKWGVKLGAKDIYVRELFRFARDINWAVADRDAVAYSNKNHVLVPPMQRLLEQHGFSLLSEQREFLRDKTEWAFTHSPSGMRVYLSSLEIGSESPKGWPYLVLMPDAVLYNGWLGSKCKVTRAMMASVAS